MPDFQGIVQRGSILYTVIDENGTVVYQNPAVASVIGREVDELVGNDFLEYVHPDDREHIEGVCRDPSSWNEGTSVDFRLQSEDATWIWMTIAGQPRSRPESGHTVLTTYPVSERKELERRVERFEVILDSIDDGVYAIEPDGTIVYVNEAYASMKGVDRSALIGTNIYSGGSTEAAREISDVRERLESGEEEAGVVEFAFTTVDDDPIPVELHFGSVEQPGNELERVGVMRDVTNRKAREEALQRKNDRLEEFASIVSHDLRNPLNVAQGRLELARDGSESEHIDGASDALDRMNLLIDDLLRLAREGKQVRDMESVDLGEIARKCWANVDTKGSTLHVDTDRTIMADHTRLRQLLENLYGNAVEHAGEDVTVTIEETDRGLYVEDDGRGIPEQERSRVFETGHTTSADGTGFGLSIVRQIADAHGWDVRVTEGSDGGARFEFSGVQTPD